MSDFIRYGLRYLILLLTQVYLLNKIPHLHRFITPYLYYLFILWLPFHMPRQLLIFIGFITGLILDYFTVTPGLHAAACCLIAYVRPFLLDLLLPKEVSEMNYKEPSPTSLNWGPYLFYAMVLTLLHHGYLLFLEWLSFGRFLDFVIKVISTTFISLMMILAVELLFPRKKKVRA
ncbi:MAG: rod shape-determining protein MreD [Chitinophagaceae bacterium]|nr:rod shape-determining protein MreD [Chitinophagaceae bacterium]